MRSSTFLLLGTLPLLAAAGCAAAKAPALSDGPGVSADAGDLTQPAPADADVGLVSLDRGRDGPGGAPGQDAAADNGRPDRGRDLSPGEPNPCLGKTCNDNLPCTTDSCLAGVCKHTLKAGYCLIGGACRGSGTQNPANTCKRCIPTKSKSAWSAGPDGVACASDSLGCTTDSCQAGTCKHTLKPGYCAITGTCHVQGANRPGVDCQQCRPGQSNNSWSAAVDGAACSPDAFSCTSDSCKAGICTHPLKSNRCRIGGVCYNAGAPHPVAPCQVCAPASSATTWSASSNGTSCMPDSYFCTQDFCQAGQCLHPILGGYCLIGGKCYSNGTPNPNGSCTLCSANNNNKNWSSVNYNGCCNGQQLWYCESGVLKTLDCSLNPSCGWDSYYQFYDCGTSGGTGTTPKGC